MHKATGPLPVLLINSLPSASSVITLLFPDGFKIVSPRSQSRLLQCLGLVGEPKPSYQSQQMQLYRYWVDSSTSITLFH